MSYRNNFTESNNQSCSCGQHRGIGRWNAHERAQSYNWFREKYQSEYSGAMQNYLESYERVHGKLGGNEFIFNSSRWKDDEKVIAASHGAPFRLKD